MTKATSELTDAILRLAGEVAELRAELIETRTTCRAIAGEWTQAVTQEVAS